MSKSVSFRHGTELSRGHNIRDAKSIKNQEHIDKSRLNQNLIFVDRDIKKVYEEIFGESFKKYNSNLRKDRQSKSYYDKIKNDSQKKLLYECIAQIGTERDTGYSSELEKRALIKYANEWEERNPNLKLVGMYMHNDEATSHLHIDYIPVSYNNKRGMKIQNSLTGALKEQGFTGEGITDTAQMRWQNSERLALESICLAMGVDAKANQGLCRTKYFDNKTGTIKEGSRKHLSTFDYKKAREEMLSEVTEEYNQQKEKNNQLKKENDQLEKEVAKLNKDIIRKTESLNVPLMKIPELPEMVTVKGVFGKEKTRPITEEERTIKQQEIDNIKKQNELIQQQALLREMEIIIREQEEKQKERFQKQNVELEELEKVKLTLQNEIADLEHKKAEIIENADKIVKEKVDNALNNLDEFNKYYENKREFDEKFRKYLNNNEIGEKYESRNVEHNKNLGL